MFQNRIKAEMFSVPKVLTPCTSKESESSSSSSKVTDSETNSAKNKDGSVGGNSATTETPSSKTKSKKVRKALKDPAAPKKPLSAYLLFSQEVRPIVIAELGNLAVGDIMKEVAKRWSVVDNVTKEKYEKAHELDKQRYDSEVKSYCPSDEFLAKQAMYKVNAVSNMDVKKGIAEYFAFLNEHWRNVAKECKDSSPKEVQDRVWNMWNNNSEKSKKKSKKVRDPQEPKRPLSAFFLFQNHMRKELAKLGNNVGNKELMSSISEKWATLDPDMKREYEGQASKLKEEYLVAMEKFKAEKKED